MGTRSETSFYDETGKEVCRVYRQMDGYPSGHGLDLAKLCDVKLVNGYSLADKAGTHANGMGCLIAQVIAGLKDGIGGIYVVPSNEPSGEWLDYTYKIRPEGEHVLVECLDGDQQSLFNLPAKKIADWVKTHENV